MPTKTNKPFSGPVVVFHDTRLPEQATPAGYAALIHAYELAAPLPRTLVGTGERHRVINKGRWRILTPRHAPRATLEDHLTFALKYEGLDLCVLKRLFERVGPRDIECIVRSKPTGSYSRRIWFLYEWLTGHQLDLPDAKTGSYVLVVDPKHQFGTTAVTSPRHRVKENLPGTPRFCPLVHRTPALEDFRSLNLRERAEQIAAEVPADVLARAASFFLLNDSKASFAIEGERPPHTRVERWGQAISKAGQERIDLNELLRLQRVVIGDNRFLELGLRKEDGFVGQHDRITGRALPDHISARPEDLPSLVEGMIEFDSEPASSMDPVIAAAVLAFGFVYVHPFQDGNGRIHRYLIHHILAKRGFNPPGVVFPISAVILAEIEQYREVLEDYSTRLLPLVSWEPTAGGNVEVRNDTADLYRFFDATPHAEFLYKCVRKTIEQQLPDETEFLRRYDQFAAKTQTIADMPSRKIDLLFRFLRQNNGQLSKRARDGEFAALSDDEADTISRAYRELFDGPDS